MVVDRPVVVEKQVPVPVREPIFVDRIVERLVQVPVQVPVEVRLRLMSNVLLIVPWCACPLSPPSCWSLRLA